MKIVLINQNWFAEDFKAMGHEVVTVGTAAHLDIRLDNPIVHIDTLLQLLPKGFKPDRLIWLDNSSPMAILGIEDCSIPAVFYSVDTHHHHVRHALLAHCFDHTLVAQKDYLPHFTESEQRVSWLPLWASEYIRPQSEKKYGAAFVGTLNPKLNPKRVKFFNRLRDKVPVKVLEGHFASIFPHAEIIINQTVKGDLNFRVFEAMMSGAVLLTEKTDNGLLELFEDGTHLVTYTTDDIDDAAAKITALLSEPTRCKLIGAAGREKVLNEHCPSHRAAAVSELLTTLSKRTPHPKRHLGPLVECLSLGIMINEKHPVIALQLFSVCLDLAEKVLANKVPLTHDECLYIVRASLLYHQKDNSGRGSKMLAQLRECSPQSPLLPLLQANLLETQGLTTQAHSLARQLRPESPAEETIQLARQAAEMIL